jgi:hypothetical protein
VVYACDFFSVNLDQRFFLGGILRGEFFLLCDFNIVEGICFIVYLLRLLPSLWLLRLLKLLGALLDKLSFAFVFLAASYACVSR